MTSNELDRAGLRKAGDLGGRSMARHREFDSFRDTIQESRFTHLGTTNLLRYADPPGSPEDRPGQWEAPT